MVTISRVAGHAYDGDFDDHHVGGYHDYAPTEPAPVDGDDDDGDDGNGFDYAPAAWKL